MLCIVSASSCAATGRMFSVASTAAMSTFVGVYGPSKMHFLRYSPFDLVSRYRRKSNATEISPGPKHRVKLEESKARFDKWKESSKNLDKLINSSMSSRSKFGLGFGETFGSDEVFDPSAPSIFDTTPEDVEGKPLYDRFVKAVGMHAVPSPITGTFMPPSNKPDLDDTQVTYGSKSNNYFETNSVSNDFVSCDNSDKSSDSETTGFASCVSSVKSSSSKTNEHLASASSSVDFKTVSKTADQKPSSTIDDPSFSFKENVKTPRNICNKSGINNRSHCKNNSFGSKTCFVCGSKFHLIKDCDFYEQQLGLYNKPMWHNVANNPSFVPRAAHVPAGSRNPPESVSAGSAFPAGSRNRPAFVSAGRPFSAGWRNHAARPMTRPTSHYFQYFKRPGCYNQLNMDKGRWGTAVKTSAGCSWKIKRPNMQWGSKNNGGSHQSTWFNSSNDHTLALAQSRNDLETLNSGGSKCMTDNKAKLDDFMKICRTCFWLLCSLEVEMAEFTWKRGLEGIEVMQHPQQTGIAERKNKTLYRSSNVLGENLRESLMEGFIVVVILVSKTDQPAGSQDSNIHAVPDYAVGNLQGRDLLLILHMPPMYS
ncbi:hypothetical protein Tco_1080708 [Tanacetum coccineum]|uniref:Uncharacterized protein n=1 Tax=Tanacetum coccineum TaxID=301880 RepID=A0ABQ5HVJ4_9ASTR